MKQVFLIGTGTNGTSSLTAEASAAIRSADLLIGAKRMLEPFAALQKQTVCAYQPEQVAEIIRSGDAERIAVLFSGDSSFFSGAKNLLPIMNNIHITVLPGISSMSAMCAKCGLQYENMKFISLHGTTANIAVHAATNHSCFFLLGGDMTASKLCQRLCDYGLSDIQVYIGMNLGYENEKVLVGKASDFLAVQTETLSVLITVNSSYLRYIPCAIPDSQFIRGQIPMTKSEVRCNAVSLLRIPHDAICWDIGCGTGSVSVEMAFRCPDGQVYSFDQKQEAVQLTEQNAHHFACDHIRTVQGKCPDCLHNIPSPDVVFIGGSGGLLNEIFEEIQKKNPKAAVTMTAVSLETLSHAVRIFEQYCGEYYTVQIAVTRTKKVGEHTMFDAQNPVWLISGELKCSG